MLTRTPPGHPRGDGRGPRAIDVPLSARRAEGRIDGRVGEPRRHDGRQEPGDRLAAHDPAHAEQHGEEDRGRQQERNERRPRELGGRDAERPRRVRDDRMLTQEEAARQDRSLSWIVQKAWKIARKDIMKYPSVNEIADDGPDDERGRNE